MSNAFFIALISQEYIWRCPTSILAKELLVISHPDTCNFAANCSCVKFFFSRIIRIFSPINRS